MSKLRFAPIGLLLAAIGLTTVPAMVGLTSTAYAQTTLRPEIGKPLQEAQELMKKKRYSEALNKIHGLDSVGGKTPIEVSMIERTRGSIALQAGDNGTAARAFETALDTGKLPAGEQLRFVQTLGGLYYQLRNYPKAISYLTRYQKEGGNDPKMRALLVQTYYLNGEYSRAAKEVQSAIQSDAKAGRAPSEDELSLLANCADKMKDKGLYVSAMEKLVAYYPKKEYWADLLNRVQNKPGFSDRLTLDVLRLKLALGQLQSVDNYMEAAQLSLQEGYPAEAMKIVDQGFKNGVLGTGAEAGRHQRLRDLIAKRLADDQKNLAQTEKEAEANKDGTDLVKLGYVYVTLGQGAKGVELMQKGLKKDNIKREEDAKLHTGLAMLQAGRKGPAVQMLKSVRGTDGAADLARYWVLYANHS